MILDNDVIVLIISYSCFTAPVVKKAAPVIKQAAPVVKKAVPVVKKAAAPVVKPPAPKKEASSPFANIFGASSTPKSKPVVKKPEVKKPEPKAVAPPPKVPPIASSNAMTDALTGKSALVLFHV